MLRILSENILEEHNLGAGEGRSSSEEEGEMRSMRVITTLGELSMLAYRRITNRLFLLLQSIAFFKVSESFLLKGESVLHQDEPFLLLQSIAFFKVSDSFLLQGESGLQEWRAEPSLNVARDFSRTLKIIIHKFIW